MHRRPLLFAAAAAWLVPAAAAARARVLLIRHAVTEPGLGDPPGFDVARCATQRNLSEAGRDQARRLGERIAALGLAPQRVRSSPWCRCLDTARLAFGGAEPWHALASLHGAPERAAAQTEALRRELAALARGRIEAWVTHAATIAAWTGLATAMGETLVIEADGAGVRLLERITV